MKTLIFLHGFPDDSSVWEHQINFLKNDFEVMALDLYHLTFQDQIKTVTQLAKGLKDQGEVILVGHDMGGPLGCEVARFHPELISKLLLINTVSLDQFVYRWKNLNQLKRSFYVPFFAGPLHYPKILKLIGRKFLNTAYDQGRISPSDPIRNTSPETIEGVKRYREIAKILPQIVLKPRGKLSVETHFFYGSKDAFLVTPDDEELKHLFENVTLEVVKTGHWSQRTAPDEVNQWIKKKA